MWANSVGGFGGVGCGVWDGLRQSEGEDVVTDFGFEARVATRADDNVLFAINLVGHGCGVPASREGILPDDFAGDSIESTEDVVGCAPDEDESTAGGRCTAEVERAPGFGPGHSLSVLCDSEGGRPLEIPGAKVDGNQASPGWWV